MADFPQGFSEFEFSNAHAASLRSEFTLLLSETDLSRCGRVDHVIADYKQSSGIYFWVMRHAERSFRIYIGKTKSMSHRMQNYVSEFQPHSPNDYKLRIFRRFISDAAPDATLDLYFSARPSHDLTEAENLAITTYDPLLNRRLRPSDKARQNLQSAFSAYYCSAFGQLLSDKG